MKKNFIWKTVQLTVTDSYVRVSAKFKYSDRLVHSSLLEARPSDKRWTRCIP